VILQAQPALDTARIFASIVVLSGLALALYALVTLVERLVTPWQWETRDGA
jgi:ABC-type nitrate/sulfonate/bicarbonate transport system permease component